MNIVKPISLSQITTSELLKGGKSLLSITESLTLTYTFVARQRAGIEDAIAKLAMVDNEERTHENTPEIRQLDGSVDMLIPLIEDDLQGTVKKAAFMPDAADSAKKILELYAKRNRKKLIYGSYTDQGREADALFSELFSDEFTDHRNIAGISAMADKLLADYTELQKLLNERLNQGNFATTQKEQKGLLRYRMDKLLSHIDVNIFDEVEGFPAIETPVNELITEIMSEYKARITRKENKAQEN